MRGTGKALTPDPSPFGRGNLYYSKCAIMNEVPPVGLSPNRWKIQQEA